MTNQPSNNVPSVLFINNDGGGFATRIPISHGTPLADFLSQQCPNVANFGDYRITLNHEKVIERSTPLKDGDRVSLTPIKVDNGL